MIKLFTLITLFTATAALAKPEVVHRQKPTPPVYLSEEFYPALKKTIPLPPSKGSPIQTEDERVLLEYQHNRTAKDCAAAKEEIFFNIEKFYSKPIGSLDKPTVQKLTPFFKQVVNDADVFTQKLKKEFPRKRPFVYIKEIHPCVARETTMSYPSGHAIAAKLMALILSDLYPKEREAIEARAVEVGKHRVQAGMHHPSDIEVGRQVAITLYEEMKNSPKFQADFAKLKP